jgi:indole-3-glycerol phosphate synthase
MTDVDVGTIVPSTRDLLQVIGTRRRNLALLGLIDQSAEAAGAEAGKLADLNVSAFAFDSAGPAMTAAARATKTVPALCLAPAGDREAMLRARQHGADGVCIDAALPIDDWDRLAKIARSMRMLPLAIAADGAGLDAAIKAGARAVVLRCATATEVVEIAGRAPRNVTLVGFVPTADADALRALAAKVDAAVVPPGLHAQKGFAELVAEVDP